MGPGVKEEPFGAPHFPDAEGWHYYGGVPDDDGDADVFQHWRHQ